MKSKKSFLLLIPVLFLALTSCSQNRLYGREATDWTKEQKEVIKTNLGEDVKLPFMFLPAMDLMSFSMDNNTENPPTHETGEEEQNNNLSGVLARAPQGKQAQVNAYVELLVAPTNSQALKKFGNAEFTNLFLDQIVGDLDGMTLLNSDGYEVAVLQRQLNDNEILVMMVGLVFFNESATPDETGKLVSLNHNFIFVAIKVPKSFFPELSEVVSELLDYFNDGTRNMSEEDRDDITNALEDYIEPVGEDEDGNPVYDTTSIVPDAVFPSSTTTISEDPDNGQPIIEVTTSVPPEYEEDAQEIMNVIGESPELIEEARQVVLEYFEKQLLDLGYIAYGIKQGDTGANGETINLYYKVISPGYYSLASVYIDMTGVLPELVSEYKVVSVLPPYYAG